MKDKANLKFTIDVGVERIIEESVEQQGFNITSIAKLNPEMPDSNILKIDFFDLIVTLHFKN